MSTKVTTIVVLFCVLLSLLVSVDGAKKHAKKPARVKAPSDVSSAIPTAPKHPYFNVMAVTTRQQFLQKTGRIRWAAEEKTEMWIPQQVGLIVVDMWDQHWCPSATERVESLGIFINNTLNVARQLGVQIIHAPSECDAYYVNHPSRLWTLALPNVTMPTDPPRNVPDLPIVINDPNDGCDVPGAYQHPVWTKETDLITIHPEDALIEDTDNGQTLWNLVVYRGLKHLIYVGVHENLCIMNRSFAIKETSGWGIEVAVTREATDTMYEPSQPPYCSHDMSVDLMTQYVEKWWGKSVSAYDFLNPRNSTSF